jgi:hypothetical protein
MKCPATKSGLLSLLLMAGTAAAADDAVPDKSGYDLFDPTPDSLLRSFNTDRPPKANSPYTVDAGHFQYETDLVVFGHGDSGGVDSQDWTVFDPTLKLGLTNMIDAELQITPYESMQTKTAQDTVRLSGLGDTYARLKVNLLGDDGGDIAVALLPYVKLPTARLGLGNGKVEGGMNLPVSINAPGGFTVIVMPEVDDLKDAADGSYHRAADFLINVSHPLDEKWTFYTEVFTTQSFDDRDKPIYTFDEAFTLALNPNLQLDFGGNFSVNGGAPQFQIYSGLSQRF